MPESRSELIISAIRGYPRHCTIMLQAACGPTESLADEERNCKYDFIGCKSHRSPGNRDPLMSLQSPSLISERTSHLQTYPQQAICPENREQISGSGSGNEKELLSFGR